jgi:hypothetical protein
MGGDRWKEREREREKLTFLKCSVSIFNIFLSKIIESNAVETGRNNCGER